MQYSLKVLGFGFVLAAGLAVSACGGEDDGGEPGEGGGTTSAGGSSAGSGGSGTGGTSANGGTGAGSAGGSSGGSGSGGAAGSSANGGTAGTAGTGSGGTATSGGSGGTGGGGEACTPASTDGIAFSGSCTTADHCSDQYDTTFGVEALEQICTSQSGTWSTAHCNAADWDKKCTQDVLGGIYVQYLLSDGICALGCEEAL